MAQFVTPPPATNPDPNKDIPKAPAPPPPPPPSAAAPAAPKIQQAKPVKEPIPNLPFKEWEKDASGAMVPLNEPLELAALRRNPLVTADTMAKIEAYVPDRRKAMERIRQEMRKKFMLDAQRQEARAEIKPVGYDEDIIVDDESVQV
jgi:hypothetical protein